MAETVSIPMTTIKAQLAHRQHDIGVIGTGNYAVALAKRLTTSGFDVIMGSRWPEKRQRQLSNGPICGVHVTSISECLKKSEVIFVAIHANDFKITLNKFVEETQGKILIDVSNRDIRHNRQSNAEYMASILPGAIVVKAFNSISAFTMEDINSSGGSHRVFIASNNATARATVADIARAIGFSVIDLGRLRSSLRMEESVLKEFSRWKAPLLLTSGIFSLWMLYVVYIYYIEAEEFHWEQLFLKVFNKPLCMTAITILALTYLAGHVAAMVQIYNGTKHIPFPRLLASWLRSRKQLGLISLFLVSMHVIASTLMLSPTYYSSWFHSTTVTLLANTTLNSELVLPVSSSWMEWKGEAACLAGIFSFLLMIIIGLTSIPSVGESLNWSEWLCIHTTLSYLVLILATGHVFIMAVPNWVKDGPVKTLKSITFLSVVLPLLVLCLKLIFVCSPLKGYVWKIRKGWERGAVVLPVTVEVEQESGHGYVTRPCIENGAIVPGGCCHEAANGSMLCSGKRGSVNAANVKCQCSSS